MTAAAGRVGLVTLMAGGALWAQGLTAVIEPRYRETPRPVAAPEPKRRIGVEPLALLRFLQSPVATERAKGFEGLGLTGRSDAIPEVQFRSLNLDVDAALEAVMFIENGPGASVHVLDRQADGWWEVGVLYTGGGRWDPRQAERLISFRRIVDYPQWDLVVRHQTASGTGVSTQGLALYRMYRGSLYRIFATVESHYDFVTEQAVEIEANDEDGRKPPVLVVRSKTSQPTDDGKTLRRSSCETWRWNHRRFQFVIDPSARAQCKAPLVPSRRL